ncbi:uncharacterized protein FIBRA_00153 [Fibroporia radiculosa]|uniref:Ribosomal protein L10 n=1 Tax=Fibroporia radiculosa TaxID=599839 RepID=J7S5R1_9APHY|nr:uncharacterized protein FIBRA_00153 [Fibroporia radiculosa]CCL98159.1 predicted protein [Fibroporia radiculosa]
MLALPSRVSCIIPALRNVRTYVVSIEPPRVYPNKTVPRNYSERKTYLYNQYTRLFQSSFDSPLIFLQHTDFSVPRLIRLRRDIAAAAARHASAPTLAGPSPAAMAEPPTLTVLRTSIFGVTLRDFSPLDTQAVTEIAGMIEGGLAVLSFPSFNPPQMNAILRALSRAVPPRVPKTPQEIEQQKKDVEAAFVPGRRQKRQRPVPVPELKLVGALIEGRVFKAPGVWDVAGLPTLEILRAQLVGLLSAPASQLALVLGEAGGGKLARTLEGLRKSLEEEKGELETGKQSDIGAP